MTRLLALPLHPGTISRWNSPGLAADFITKDIVYIHQRDFMHIDMLAAKSDKFTGYLYLKRIATTDVIVECEDPTVTWALHKKFKDKEWWEGDPDLIEEIHFNERMGISTQEIPTTN
jgi:hypothetical protein